MCKKAEIDFNGISAFFIHAKEISMNAINSSKKFRFPRKHFYIALLLVAATVSVYWPVGNFGFFQIDDPNYIIENPNVSQGFTLKSVIWAFTSFHALNWHPLTWLSHMGDVALYGLNPGAHHLTNLVFHSLNTLLLFFAFRKMTGALWPSAFVAALFAVHPIHVESVAWVAERKDVLSTFFGLLTILSYAGFVSCRRWTRYGLTLMFFIFGLMSKPMIVTLPFVLLLLDIWPLGRFDWDDSSESLMTGGLYKNRGLFVEKTPFFVLSALAGTVTFIAQKEGGALLSLHYLPFQVRIENMLVTYIKYIGKTIWPSKLAFMYPYPIQFPLWQTIGSLLLLTLFTIMVIRLIRCRSYLAVGWFWYLGTLIPVIGLVQVGIQPMADRYTYIPSIGIFIMMVWGIQDFLRKCRYKQIITAVSALIVLIFLMGKTCQQVQYWRDTTTLLRHTLRVTENNYVIHFDLARALERENRYNEAIEHYRVALRIKPDFAPAHNAMGEVLRRKKELDQAIVHYLQAIRYYPNYAEAYNNLGVALLMQNRTDEAIRSFREALRIKPDYLSPRRNLNKVLQSEAGR